MESRKMLVVSRSFVKMVAILVCVVWPTVVHAQDPVFTQFYLNKNYLNPAYAGIDGKPSVALNSRLQYAGIPGALASNTFSFNFGGNETTGGMGFAVLYSDNVEGEGFLHTMNFAGQASATIRVNKGRYRKPFLISVGLQFGVGQKKVNWENLQFTDQFDPYKSGVQNPTYVTPQNNSSNVYFDAALGIKGYLPVGKSRRNSYITFGFASFHVNKPEQSFFGVDAYLSPRYNFFGFFHFGSYEVNDDKRKYLSIGMLRDVQSGLITNNFSVFQGITQEFTVGLSFRRQNFFVAGGSVDAIAGHVLYAHRKWQVGYSYDFTISQLGINNTLGTHEIGVVYLFGKKSKFRRTTKWKHGDPCPQPGSVL